MNRREFLDTGSLARTAGPILAPWLDCPDKPPSPIPDASLLRFSRRAMATLFEVLFPFDTDAAAEAANEALDLIDNLEAQMTVYREDSEVSAINRHAANGEIVVEPRLFELLAESARLAAETGGAFDITTGPLIKAWGFFCRQGRVPTPSERQEALERVGMRHIELNTDLLTICFRRPGVEVNLGSIGKGYALDRAAELVRTRGIATALLHGGGSSVLALGSQPGGERGWPVAIRHPWRDDGPLATIYLRNCAVGTSAATFQHFEYNSRKLGHLLDPRTGRPAEGIASATALAPTAAQADALATAFYVLGVEKTRAFCQTHSGIGAVLLPDGVEEPVVIGLQPSEISVAAPPWTVS